MAAGGDAYPKRAMELLWSAGATRSRGPKPTLGVAEIVRVAVEVADAEGLAAVTMRRIATELGFTTMALYRHVPGKHVLAELMIDATIVGPDEDRSTEGWRAPLSDWAVDYFGMLLAHPWLLEVDLVGAAWGPNRVAYMERGLRALASTGLPSAEMMGLLLTLTGYVHGSAQILFAAANAAHAERVAGEEFGAVYGRTLAAVVTEERFPLLAGVLADGVFELPDDGGMQDFTFGLERVLDGFATHLTQFRT